MKSLYLVPMLLLSIALIGCGKPVQSTVEPDEVSTDIVESKPTEPEEQKEIIVESELDDSTEAVEQDYSYPTSLGYDVHPAVNVFGETDLDLGEKVAEGIYQSSNLEFPDVYFVDNMSSLNDLVSIEITNISNPEGLDNGKIEYTITNNSKRDIKSILFCFVYYDENGYPIAIDGLSNELQVETNAFVHMHNDKTLIKEDVVEDYCYADEVIPKGTKIIPYIFNIVYWDTDRESKEVCLSMTSKQEYEFRQKIQAPLEQ